MCTFFNCVIVQFVASVDTDIISLKNILTKYIERLNRWQLYQKKKKNHAGEYKNNKSWSKSWEGSQKTNLRIVLAATRDNNLRERSAGRFSSCCCDSCGSCHYSIKPSNELKTRKHLCILNNYSLFPNADKGLGIFTSEIIERTGRTSLAEASWFMTSDMSSKFGSSLLFESPYTKGRW